MGCCGNKRKAWQEQIGQNKHDESDLSSLEQSDTNRSIIFEYTGSESISVKGIVSGKIYRFLKSGSRVEIDYADSFALMAEYDFRIVRV
jgi:hypothetical protein